MLCPDNQKKGNTMARKTIAQCEQRIEDLEARSSRWKELAEANAVALEETKEPIARQAAILKERTGELDSTLRENNRLRDQFGAVRRQVNCMNTAVLDLWGSEGAGRLLLKQNEIAASNGEPTIPF